MYGLALAGGEWVANPISSFCASAIAMASLPQGRFARRDAPEPKKPKFTDTTRIVVTGEEYTYQKGDLDGKKTGNVGLRFDFHKSLNNIIKDALMPIDLMDEFKWNQKRGDHQMKLAPGIQLDAVLQIINDIAKACVPSKSPAATLDSDR